MATTDDQQEILICNFKKNPSNRLGNSAASSNSFNAAQNSGRDEELMGSIQIPCVHFVNYNTECKFVHDQDPKILPGLDEIEKKISHLF